MKHKHSEVIKAFVDGIECEFYSHELKKWGCVTQLETFDWAHTVRIKPEPQKEQEPQYLYVYRNIDTSKIMTSSTLLRNTSDWNYLGKVRVEK